MQAIQQLQEARRPKLSIQIVKHCRKITLVLNATTDII
jgi:hypothetical protein